MKPGKTSPHTEEDECVDGKLVNCSMKVTEFVVRPPSAKQRWAFCHSSLQNKLPPRKKHLKAPKFSEIRLFCFHGNFHKIKAISKVQFLILLYRHPMS